MIKPKDIKPITGDEAGREILLDLAKWVDNVKNGRMGDAGRKSREELTDMLYGLWSEEDVSVYNDFRSAQEFLHIKYKTSITVNNEAKIAWLTYMREMDMLALALTHNDPILDDFKPAVYYQWQSISVLHMDFRIAAEASAAYCALMRVVSDALKIPELRELENPLYLSRFHETHTRTADITARLHKSALPGAKELLGVIEAHGELELRPKVSADLIRKAKAAMRLKKPLAGRIMRASGILVLGG